ncbi:helix-turn-helix domain-containing protein [uncultured Hyphomonas sp.]|uniref:helix-turn-helix transcriptional regulator n=1 Tax=uncultured Hyphomonas sp. TaxID=225298 RepID=UPI000C5399F5|nr:DNA-binding protein [Hyphomonadaceae bacterium]HBL93846.1 DNA-binding protein [Hyphomonas sp.]HCN92013.1 DNA-binding protein [Hyphomonas sp.]|tara:strand:+ start:3430 stop:3684 length:255 start_codon:yes stop_codon:yes gene_type:complete
MSDESNSTRALRPNPTPPAPTDWLNTDETAGQLGLKPKTLINMRSLGTGPVYHKIGAKVWYRGRDIIAYTNSRRFMGTGLRDES